MIHHFEQITFINIEDITATLVTFNACFYRIKYNLTDRDELINPYSIVISYGETIMSIVN